MNRNYLHKIDILWNWRYWPMQLLYAPLTLYLLLIGPLRTGRLFFFSAANPEVSLGGFAGDSKMAILERIPEEVRPTSLLLTRSTNSTDALKQIQEKIGFPLIAKPDLGEGGFLVQQLHTVEEWEHYHNNYAMDYIVQPFITSPVEVSIHIHVSEDKLHISGITEKRLARIQGDGVSTIDELLQQQKNTRFCRKQLRRILGERLAEVVPSDEVIQPGCVGNWGYGTTFHARPEWNTETMRKVMEKINSATGLFQYARYDIKCDSAEALMEGKFFVLEINGVKGEAIHIYDPGNTLLGAYREIFKHWEYILQISRKNIRSGFQCPGIREGFSILKRHKQQLNMTKTKINP